MDLYIPRFALTGNQPPKMPKLKTHRSSAKRFKRRGGSNLKRQKAYGTHMLSKRSTKRKRELRQNLEVSAADNVNVRRALGMK